LATGLARLAGDPQIRTRLGLQARRFVCAQRDWNHTAQAYTDTYRKLLRDSPERRGHAPGRAPA
jgi:glycosyltransferase involved in cell wall biosynthesis